MSGLSRVVRNRRGLLGGIVVAVMLAARSGGASQSRVLQYGDSGDAGERDKSRVVGYLAAAFSASA